MDDRERGTGDGTERNGTQMAAPYAERGENPCVYSRALRGNDTMGFRPHCVLAIALRSSGKERRVRKYSSCRCRKAAIDT